MKRAILTIGFIATFACSDVATQAIDNMVTQIKKPRKGIALKKLSSTPDPFVVVKKDINVTNIIVPKAKRKDLVLGGIVNHQAYIDGAWHKEDDNISGYTLKYVGTRGVVLVDGEHIKRLFLHKKREELVTMKEDE